MIPQEVIRAKRDGETLPAASIHEFILALAENRISDGQVAAFAMAVWFKGMDNAETVALTLAMRDSGEVMSWKGIDKPIGDKHSTGGIGDNVSLMLAPIAAACGIAVPMISGRGLGHTGGTLDKLESIPGYNPFPSKERFSSVVSEIGCAIVGQTGQIAPADKRLYAIRDVTATVDSMPLITGSILSKKLAAGLQSLVMDVKTGNGAFMQDLDDARALARSIVDVAKGAGVETTALVTDMNEPLADCAGNAVEIVHAMEFLSGKKANTRIFETVMAFAVEMILNAKIASDATDAYRKALAALESGRAMEIFGRMVHAMGGPANFEENWRTYLPDAPVVLPVPSPRSGFVSSYATRDIGLAVIGLGGGRIRPDDRIDHRTGFSAIASRGQMVEKGEPLAFVHASTEDGARRGISDFLATVEFSDTAAKTDPVVVEKIS